MAGSSSENEDIGDKERKGQEAGKYVRYTNEQVEALERVYNECPKPSSVRRQQLIRECPILSNIEPKQIKVWFQNRRCRERQRMESNRLQTMNQKLTALNKLLVEENELATKKISQLSMENAILRQQLAKYENVVKLEGEAGSKIVSLIANHVQQQQQQTHSHGQQGPKLDIPLLMAQASQGLAGVQESIAQAQGHAPNQFGLQQGVGGAVPQSLDNSQESVVTNNLQGGLDARGETSTSGLLTIAEEILGEFVAKATGTAIDFVEMPGMKAGSDFIGRVTVASSGPGVAARAAGLVALEPAKSADLLKDRMSWLRDCRRCDVLGGFRTANGGTVELIYTQMYAPTTLAPPRDFCTLRYTSILEDGGVVICERSLNSAHGGATMPAVPSFVRAEMLPSGYLIRPCNGGGCVVIAVDHMDLEPWSIPEVLRPLYESSTALAQRVTVEALRYLRRVAQETSGTDVGVSGSAQQLAAWRAIAERIAMGFNEAVNGFSDDNWVQLSSDGLDDISVAARPTLHNKTTGSNAMADGPGPIGGGVLCAKASMLLQNVPPALLIRFLRDHRSEWADGDVDADSAAAVRASLAGRAEKGNGQVPLPLAYAVDQEEFLELVKLEGQSQGQDGGVIPRETFLLQLCSGVDETATASAQLVFAPVDAASTADTVPLLPSGFRVIPLDYGPTERQGQAGSRTLDLASALEGQSESGRRGPEAAGSSMRSVLTIAFQFVYEGSTREAVASLARHYVRSVVGSVQRIAMALAPAKLSMGPSRSPPKTPEAQLLARRILQSYRLHVGMELIRQETIQSGDSHLTAFWELPDAIICVAWKTSPELLFANLAGLDMMDATVATLADIQWEKTYDDEGRKTAYSAISQVMQQGYAYLPPGVRLSRTGRPAGYERAVAWKVVDEEDNLHCIAFMHIQWSLMS